MIWNDYMINRLFKIAPMKHLLDFLNLKKRHNYLIGAKPTTWNFILLVLNTYLSSAMSRNLSSKNWFITNHCQSSMKQVTMMQILSVPHLTLKSYRLEALRIRLTRSMHLQTEHLKSTFVKNFSNFKKFKNFLLIW